MNTDRQLIRLIGVLIVLAAVLAMIVLRPANSASGRGLTADMIQIALSSAHISTAPGSQMKLLDRRTGQWHDFVLRQFSIRASGQHATIEIEAAEVN
jgi:hypothetical protein